MFPILTVHNLILTREYDGEYSAYYSAYELSEQEKEMVADNQYVEIPKAFMCALVDFDASSITKRGGGSGSSEIITRDGKCFKRVLRRSSSFTSIPGQLEFSAFEWKEEETPCPKDDDGGNNNGGGSGGSGGFGNIIIDIFTPIPFEPAVPNPSAPGGGGWTPSVPPRVLAPVITHPVIDDTTADECQKIANALGSSAVKAKLAEIAGKVNDTVNEHGFGVKGDGTIIDFVPSPELKVIVDATTVYNVLSHIHNNPANGGTYSIFSWEDLQGFANLIADGAVNGEALVATLSTKKGTHYVLTISNISNFRKFWYYLFNDPDTLDAFGKQIYADSFTNMDKLRKKYYAIDRGFIRKANPNNPLILSYFLDMINETNMGISIFETDANFQNFSKVTKNSKGMVDKKQCN